MSSADSHIIEFDAPPSAIPTARSKNRYSIDLSLELEHQLELDSPLPTPANPERQQHHSRPSFQLPDIDPHVLAHIISQLRHQLADMTKERDDLLVLLSHANTKEAELQDAIQHITDKAMALDEALSDAKKKNRDDEEAISMLRTKVEESRRGLMRLQAESRRQTPAALDTSRANAPSAFMGPPSSKRASFTPLTGSFATRPNGHRRISSVSDSGLAVSDLVSPVAERSLTLAVGQPPVANRRLSAIFGRSSPPRDVPQRLPSTSPDELEKLRKELRTVQAALTETRHELTEANEAREASETCVGALRDFIAENNMGTSEVKLPPLPAMTTGEEADPNAQKKEKGWGGFKLWKVDTSVKGAPGPASDVTASPIIPAANANTPPAPAAPLSRKLTGFFGSRASISSLASSLAPLQTTAPPAPRLDHRDSVYSLSDASSLAEPISPTSQGANVGPDTVRVRDVNGSPDLAGGSPDGVHGREAVKEAPQLADDALSLRSVGI